MYVIMYTAVNNFLTLTKARENIFQLVKELEAPGRYFVLTEKGKPKAVLVSWEEFESLMETLEVTSETSKSLLYT